MNENKKYLTGEEKMFTQSDVNRIISERLSRDKQKGGDDFDKRETDLTQRELIFNAKQLLSEKKLPIEFADILKLTDEKSVEYAVALIEKLMGNTKPENTLKIGKERKLPENNKIDEDYGQLRKAFGLN